MASSDSSRDTSSYTSKKQREKDAEAWEDKMINDILEIKEKSESKEMIELKEKDKFAYVKKMTTQYPFFSERYPTIFTGIIRGDYANDDTKLYQLAEMISKQAEIRKNPNDKEKIETAYSITMAQRYLPDKYDYEKIVKDYKDYQEKDKKDKK
jgi:hypothetical protein